MAARTRRRRRATLQPAESGGRKFREICWSTGGKKKTARTMNSTNRIRVSPIVMFGRRDRRVGVTLGPPCPPPGFRKKKNQKPLGDSRRCSPRRSARVIYRHRGIDARRRGVRVAVSLSRANIYDCSGTPGDSLVSRHIYLFICFHHIVLQN